MADKETPAEKVDRLKLMVSGSPKWDLSENDEAAIQWALDEIGRVTKVKDMVLGERQRMESALIGGVRNVVCPYCCQRVELDDELKLAYHDHPRPTRRICTGAKKTMQEAAVQYSLDQLEHATRSEYDALLSELWEAGFLHGLRREPGDVTKGYLLVKCVLQTSKGETVHETEMPPWGKGAWPGVVTWGERTFVHYEHTKEYGYVYREAFRWWCPPAISGGCDCGGS